MATRLSLRKKIQQDLYDTAGIYFDDGMVNDSIQDGYDDIVVRTQCIEKVSNLTFQNGVIYYDLYNRTDIAPGFWRLSKIFNTNTNRWLDCIDMRWLDKYRFDWENTNGTPWYGNIVNYRWLGFFPHYVAGAGLQFLLMWKVGRDVLLSDSQEIQVPNQYIRGLEAWVVADMLESIQELKKAANYIADSEQQIQALKEHVASRMLPNLYMQLNDLDFPYPSLP